MTHRPVFPLEKAAWQSRKSLVLTLLLSSCATFDIYSFLICELGSRCLSYQWAGYLVVKLASFPIPLQNVSDFQGLNLEAHFIDSFPNVSLGYNLPVGGYLCEFWKQKRGRSRILCGGFPWFLMSSWDAPLKCCSSRGSHSGRLEISALLDF